MNSQGGTPLGAALGALASIDPHCPAVTCDGITVSRGQLEQQSNRLARAYTELGVRQGSFVTVALPNGVEFFESIFAVWKLGAIPQPLSARLPPRERDAIIALCDPSLVVGADTGDRPSLPAGFTGAASFSGEPLVPKVAPVWKAPTSGGSTGRPKLIVADQPGTVETVTPFAEILAMHAEGVQVATGPLHHNGPFVSAACGLLVGCHVVVMPRFDASRCLALIEQHSADWLYAVPTMMHRIWRLPDEERKSHDVSSLRTVLHLAAPCAPWLKEAWIDWIGPHRILEVYASTEAQAITRIWGDEWLEHRGSVGRAMVGEIAVLAPDGSPTEPGEVGEVWMRRGPDDHGPYYYIGAEPRSRPGGWESVGDLGWLDDDGYLYLADRKTDMILVGGSNVYAAEVEGALEEHPLVMSACVVGLPHDDLGDAPHAIVQAVGEVTDGELAAFLRTRLAPYKVPRSFERTDQALRDDAGKVRRSALRAERVAAGKVAPRRAAETRASSVVVRPVLPRD